MRNERRLDVPSSIFVSFLQQIQGLAEVHLLECGWYGTVSHEMGGNLNVSPKMSRGVLECDTVRLQKDMLMSL